jgi:hypothetical protein
MCDNLLLNDVAASSTIVGMPINERVTVSYQ